VVKAYQLLRDESKRRAYDPRYWYFHSAGGTASRFAKDDPRLNDEFFHYYKLARENRGPLYMSNGNMALLVILVTCLVGGPMGYFMLRDHPDFFMDRLSRHDPRFNRFLTKSDDDNKDS
jgi:curved DNA-binding protein CbpA